MTRLVAGLLVVALVAVILSVPTPALARHRGHFGAGIAVGAVTGLILGGIFAPRVYAAPPVVYQPAPVYVQPAPVYVQPAPAYVAPTPVCTDYWVPDHWRSGGWVQGHWERICR